MGFQVLEVYERNDEVVDLAITFDGAAYNLAGKSIEMYLKPTKGTADNDLAVVLLSTSTGDIVVSGTPTDGTAEAHIPASDLSTVGSRWYRVDVIDAGKRRTALYGPLRIIDI